MVKKKAEVINKDFTRIEDLSEFLHQEDSDLDSQFDSFSPAKTPLHDPTQTGISLDALDEVEAENPPELPDLPTDNPEEEITFEASSPDEIALDDITFEGVETNLEEDTFGDSSFEEAELTGSIDEDDNETSSDNAMELSSDAFTTNDYDTEASEFLEEPLQGEEETEVEEEKSPLYNTDNVTPEKFEDVKTFAQNFSYGQVQGGGNPPYSIIVRNIKFKEEADDIIDLLREFGILNEKNEKDTIRAVELGSIIIPQISEFTAIVLAHKFRRFDLDLEVGLSDEVHPSKSGEMNPKGLLKKDSLKQNRSESLNIADIDHSIKDIIISTSPSVPGFLVEDYIGIETAFAVVEESELEKLQYVQKSQRENSELFDLENAGPSDITSEKAFQDYQNSFSLLYADLTAQLKQKAFAQKANALLGLSFQLSPLTFDRAHTRVSAYQITCSATLATLRKDNA